MLESINSYLCRNNVAAENKYYKRKAEVSCSYFESSENGGTNNIFCF